MAQLFGLEYVVPVGRARAGVTALIEELGGAGLPVLIPSNICPSVVSATLAGGGIPVLVPVSSTSGTVSDVAFVAALARQPSPRGIVMPTHLYGRREPFAATVAAAHARGWFVLENDTLATLAVADRPEPSGDAVLTSFGSGKTIDAGGGGALLTADRPLADALSARVAAWAPLAASDDVAEQQVTLTRRSLRAQGRPDLSESLADIEMSGCRRSFDAQRAPQLSAALATFRDALDRRRHVLESWERELARLDGAIDLVTGIHAPWRLVGCFRDPHRRDPVVQALRAAGIDAGTNYPAVRETFPQRLGGQAHASADTWAASVFNLWLSEAYDAARIRSAVTTIARTLDAAPQ